MGVKLWVYKRKTPQINAVGLISLSEYLIYKPDGKSDKDAQDSTCKQRKEGVKQ